MILCPNFFILKHVNKLINLIVFFIIYREDIWGGIQILHERLTRVDQAKLFACELVSKITNHFEKIRESQTLWYGCICPYCYLFILIVIYICLLYSVISYCYCCLLLLLLAIFLILYYSTIAPALIPWQHSTFLHIYLQKKRN